MKEIKTLGEYWDALSSHDWFYMMSDSSRIYEEGLKRDGELAALTGKGPEWESLWSDFKSWKWKGTPKPERPDDKA